MFGWRSAPWLVHAQEATPNVSPEAAAGACVGATAAEAAEAAGGASTSSGGGLSGAVAGMLSPDNQFFTGGLGLAALGFAASMAGRTSTVATALARRYLLITLEVTSKDPAYPWVLSWLRAHGRPQLLSVETNLQKGVDGATKPLFDFVPGPGKHVVPYDGRLFYVDRTREQQAVALADGKPWEKVTLTAIGNDVTVFERLLGEAQSMAMSNVEGMTIIYQSWGSEWRPFGHPRPRRKLDSVVLGEGVSEAIVEDLTEWRDSQEWYHERGIPYRRGYLLHGPPGCGKSSFIFALAGHLSFDICMLSLNSDGLTDDRLELALSNVPQQTIVLLEDIDAAFVQRRAGDPNRGGGVSFSGLLNAIDGVGSGEQRVVFMTTNFIERLDPALIRPGRVDMVQLIDYASESQIAKLFRGFYPTELEAESPMPEHFAAEVTKVGLDVSMAELQGHLLRHKGQPLEALVSVEDLAAEAFARQQTSKWNTNAESNTNGGAARKDVELADDDGTTAARPKRRLHGSEADKLVFNPQEGWEDMIGQVVRKR